MSIRVVNVVKAYGRQVAVNDVSFEIGPGEIVGFLGPNGAGKSTTLKMITGYLPPTRGAVFVHGYPVQQQARAMRRNLGYLPEHNPLYPDMYVHEYLRLAGSFYGLRDAALRKRVEEVVAQCGLTGEQNKKIEALSKGYRQRVGLAQALVHNPAVLILDEPTTGLDPNQLAEIRSLIRSVSPDKTVLFSSHIMQEVQALCRRVLIIHGGKLVADQTVEQLLALHPGRHRLSVAFQEPVSAGALQSLPHVINVTALSDRSFTLHTAHPDEVRAAVFQLAAAHRLSLVSLKAEEHNLESVFQSLTAGIQP
jgi:ABC-2 type transport system ATP-binding protein